MEHKKVFIFVILFIGSLATAGYLLYSNQIVISKTNNKKIIPSPDQKQQEVRAATITSPKVKHTSEKYNSQNVQAHLKLTPENILWMTNYERSRQNVEPLKNVKALTFSSSKKNDDMLLYQYFNHIRTGDSPIGFDFFIDNQNYTFIKIGENLAMGDFTTSPEVVTAWMNSPNHKKNILDPNYKEIGIAITKGLMNNKEVVLITQHFGNPRSSCPSVNDSVNQTIETLKSNVASLASKISTEQKKVGIAHKLLDPNYNVLVEEYNVLVNSYNISVNEMSDLVSRYNEQVKSFDKCIQGNL